MTHTYFTPLLRRVLLIDAATCLLTGVMLLAAGGLLERLLAIPSALLHAAGVVLLIFGTAVAYVGTRSGLLRSAAWWIVALNALWAVASILALVAGWLDPNTLGTAFVAAQAVAVAIIAELQFVGLRRSVQVMQRA